MPCGWAGNPRSGIALVMCHILQWFIHLQAHGLRKGDEYPTYTHHGVWNSLLIPLSSRPIHMRKVKVKVLSIQKLYGKWADGQTWPVLLLSLLTWSVTIDLNQSWFVPVHRLHTWYKTVVFCVIGRFFVVNVELPESPSGVFRVRNFCWMDVTNYASACWCIVADMQVWSVTLAFIVLFSLFLHGHFAFLQPEMHKLKWGPVLRICVISCFLHAYSGHWSNRWIHELVTSMWNCFSRIFVQTRIPFWCQTNSKAVFH